MDAMTPGNGDVPPPLIDGEAGRTPQTIVAIIGITTAFAAGLLIGIFIPRGDSGDAAEAGNTVETTAAEVAGEDPAEPPQAVPTTAAGALEATPPTFFPYTAGDYGTGPCAPVEGAAEAVLSFADAPALCIDAAATHVAIFETSRGTVRVALDAATVPGTVNNFVNLARFGYYDDTLIHRSDPRIGIIQGGSPRTDDASDPGPGYRVWDEGSGFSYRPGQLVMARTSAPNSADAQFFFTVTEAAGLLDGDGTHVVFGQVTEGLGVLVDILDSHVDEPGNDFGGTPDPAVVIRSITIQTDGARPTPPEGSPDGANGG